MCGCMGSNTCACVEERVGGLGRKRCTWCVYMDISGIYVHVGVGSAGVCVHVRVGGCCVGEVVRGCVWVEVYGVCLC